MLKHDTILPSTNVGFLRVTDANPTDLSTVHTILRRSTAIPGRLRQKEMVIVIDQAYMPRPKRSVGRQGLTQRDWY